MSVKTYYRKEYIDKEKDEEYIKFKKEKYFSGDNNYYYNYGTNKEGDERIEGWKEGYITGGGGMGDGRACEYVVIKKSGIYQVDFYSGGNIVQTKIGNTIIWTNERQKDGCGAFWVLNI